MGLEGGAIEEVIVTAFSAMAKVAVIVIIGYGLALYPKESPYLSSQTLKLISKLSNGIFLPCLIVYQIGSGLSVDLMGRMSILIVFSFIISFVSYSIAGTLGKVMDQNISNLYIPMYIAVGSPNVVSLPLMIFQSLCSSPIVNADYDGDSRVCFNEAGTMLFVYSIGWHLVYWSYAFPMLKKMKDITTTATTASTTSFSLATMFQAPTIPSNLSLQTIQATLHVKAKHFLNDVILSPMLVSIYIGVFIGLIAPLRKAFFVNMTPLRPFGSALETLGEPVVCVNSLVMAASLAKVDLGFKREDFTVEAMKHYFSVVAAKLEELLLTTSTSLSMTFQQQQQQGQGDVEITSKTGTSNKATTATAFSPLHNGNMEEDVEECMPSDLNDNDEEDISAEINNNNDKNNFQPVPTQEDANNIPTTATTTTAPAPSAITPTATTTATALAKPHWRSIVTLFVCRMILPPIVVLTLLQIALSMQIVSATTDRLMCFVIVVVCSGPPAQILIVTLNQLEHVNIASGMAYLYIFMYFTAIFTMTFWTTIAMATLY